MPGKLKQVARQGTAIVFGIAGWLILIASGLALWVGLPGIRAHSVAGAYAMGFSVMGAGGFAVGALFIYLSHKI
jgi:hypothetical protein